MTVSEPGPCWFTVGAAFRTINVQLASGDEIPGRAIVVPIRVIRSLGPAPLIAANDTIPTRLDVRRLAVDGFEMFISGRGGDLGPALGRVADGCARILVEKRAYRAH